MTTDQQLLIVFLSAPLAVVAATFGGWLWSVLARSEWVRRRVKLYRVTWGQMSALNKRHVVIRVGAIGTWVLFAVMEWVL